MYIGLKSRYFVLIRDKPEGVDPMSKQSIYFSNLSTFICFPWASVRYYMGEILGKCYYNCVYIYIPKYIYPTIHIGVLFYFEGGMGVPKIL